VKEKEYNSGGQWLKLICFNIDVANSIEIRKPHKINTCVELVFSKSFIYKEHFSSVNLKAMRG
jgi:hypothetical protein